MNDADRDYELFQRGRWAYEQGDYDSAIAMFRQSFEIAVWQSREKERPYTSPK